MYEKRNRVFFPSSVSEEPLSVNETYSLASLKRL